MTIGDGMLLVTAVLLCAYLLYALLRAEEF
jgi:K+-transporting ATPase KdpF subunit